MFKQAVGSFKYYVGISSLDQIATRDDRVCVLNILGGESSDVTPVGHAYSGGNVVFGPRPAAAVRSWRRRSETSQSTTTSARVLRRDTASTAV
jgi:hypothetical protein